MKKVIKNMLLGKSQKLQSINDPYMFQHQKLTRPLLLDEIVRNLAQKKSVIVLYFDLVKFTEIEQSSGSIVSGKILKVFKKILEVEMPRLLWNLRIIAVENLWGDDYVVIFSTDSSPPISILQDLAISCRVAIKESLYREIQKLSSKPLEIHVGYSLLCTNNERPDINLYRAVREAQDIAKGKIGTQRAQLLGEFKEILDKDMVSSIYQPIISLRKGSVIGWEALARGPEGSRFMMPGHLFSFAEEVDLLFKLEKICRRKAVEQLGSLGVDQKLFLNIHPKTIKDPLFVEGETLKIIQEAGLEPKNIVFEITERQSVDDYCLINRVMDHYRNQGFLVAVDDAGSGFSSLQSIAELRPDYIKIDIALVRGIHMDSLKRTLMETMFSFSEKIGCTIIAEGIELEEELNTLTSIGVHCGQGFLLGRPARPKQLPDESIVKDIVRRSVKENMRTANSVLAIRDLAENILTVNKDTKVKEIQKLLDKNDLAPGLVILDRGKPVGLAMRNQLYNFLGAQYGVPLYYEKPISSIMDKHPLIVEESSPVELVSQMAMNRKKSKIYDFIIIVSKDGQYYGVVSIKNLLETLTRIHIDTAMGANPLSGLPGSVSIEKELNRRINDAISYAFIYLDLDHFKSYNDHYGFDRGNKVILFTARLLGRIINKYGTENDFLGHIGGDDFIIITEDSQAEILCKKVVRLFDRLIRAYYNKPDLDNGYIPGHDRECKECKYPPISISLAVISESGREKVGVQGLAEKAAQLKRYAKSIPGSVYVVDRRVYNPSAKNCFPRAQTHDEIGNL